MQPELQYKLAYDSMALVYSFLSKVASSQVLTALVACKKIGLSPVVKQLIGDE